MDENKKSMIIDLKGKNIPLVVSFGGIQNGIGFPVFEFNNILKDFNINKIFIRDFEQAWHHKGLPGCTSTIFETMDLIKEKISELSPSKVIFVGNSAGGYAALYFGYYLNPDEVHAFAPQTFLSPFKRLIHFENRWRNEIKNLKGINSKMLDLKHVFTCVDHKTRFYIYYAENYRSDKKHVTYLGKKKYITLVKIQGNDHNIIKLYKETGELRKLIQRFTAE